MVLWIAVQAAALLVMALLPVGGLVLAVAGSVVWAVGKVLADVAITITATAGVDADDKGLGAGLVATSQEVGRALGLGVLTAVVTARAGALAGTRDELAALLDGLRWGLRAGVVFLAAALVVVLGGLRARDGNDQRESGKAWTSADHRRRSTRGEAGVRHPSG